MSWPFPTVLEPMTLQHVDIVVVCCRFESGMSVAYAVRRRPPIARDGHTSVAGGSLMALVLRLALAGLIVAVVTALAAFSFAS